MDAPVAANGVYTMGTSKVLFGMAPGITAQHEAGTDTTVFFPNALSTYLIESVAPHPWHAVFPGSINSCFGIENGNSIPSLNIYPVLSRFFVLHGSEHLLIVLYLHVTATKARNETEKRGIISSVE